MKVNDRFVLLYLGIGFPLFVVCTPALLLGAAMYDDRISLSEIFDCMQGTIPVFLTYIGAILGFAFARNPFPEFMSNPEKDTLRSTIRVYATLLFSSALMLFHLSLTIVFIRESISISSYKIGSGIIMWLLSSTVGFVIAQYFGVSIRLSQGPVPRTLPMEPHENQPPS